MNMKHILTKLWRDSSILLLFIVLFVIASLYIPYFFTWPNIKGLLLSISLIGMIAMSMTFVLASGEVDLSVGSVVAFAGVAAAVVISFTQSVMLGVLAGIGSGGLIGVLHSIVVARLKINSLITTLATMEIVRGLAFLVAPRGEAVSVTNGAFFSLGINTMIGIPNPIWITALTGLVFWILLNHTVYGKNTLAIGGNADAAYLAGVRVTKTKSIIFIVQGCIAGAAGVVLASRLTSGQPNTSIGLELSVISACVLGGVSLSGGVGTISGVIVGVAIMGTVQNAMNLLNVPTFYQYLARGGILLIALLFDRFRKRT